MVPITPLLTPKNVCRRSCHCLSSSVRCTSTRVLTPRRAIIAAAVTVLPKAVKLAIQAGNRLQGRPYKWGGGHGRLDDTGYDCSGTVSYVLREAGLMKGQMPSSGFFSYGERGAGNWITIYVRKGHVFMTIAGLRLDTGWGSSRTGPKWLTKTRPGKGHVMRHPKGL